MDGVLPDSYRQEMLATLRSPRLGKPEDIAAMVVLLLRRESGKRPGDQRRRRAHPSMSDRGDRRDLFSLVPLRPA